MATITVDVDVDLDKFTNEQLIDECLKREILVGTSTESANTLSEWVERMWQAARADMRGAETLAPEEVSALHKVCSDFLYDVSGKIL